MIKPGGQTKCDELYKAEPKNWPCVPGVSEKFRLGGGRVVESAVQMWGIVLPCGGRKSGSRTEAAAKMMSAVRQANLKNGDPRTA